MRRILIAAAGLLLAAGCGASSSADKPLSVPVPVPASTLPPSPMVSKPGPQTGYLERIRYQIQEKTVVMANLSRRTSARCEPNRMTGAAGEEIMCTVGYDGLKLVWKITVTKADQTGLALDARPSGAVLTRGGVFAAFHQQFGPEGRDLRCDDMPKRELVSLGKDTDYRCQYQEEGGERVTFRVGISEGGPVFEAA